MRYILGTKVGMTQLFDVDGKVLPVTIISAEPNKVIQIKTNSNNTNSAKVGYKTIEAKKLNKAELGVFKKANCDPKQYIREFKNCEQLNVGDEIKVSIFNQGEYVDVQSITKGHGFTGAIKRWNFKVGPLGHGAGYPHRYQGSVAFGRGGSQAQRVPKGKKMSGHYGHETVTILNLAIVDVNLNKNLILILGSVPGPIGSLVTIRESIKNKNKKIDFKLITLSNKEEILKQNEALEDKEALHEANLEAEAQVAKEAAEAEAKAKAEALAKEKEAEELAKVAKEAENKAADGNTNNGEKK